MKRNVVGWTGGAACLFFALVLSAGAQTLRVLRPISGAIVRETVPIRISPGDLPADGYVSISVDGKFRTARVLPEDKNAAVYQWDTKAPFATPDDPNTQQYLGDGPHTISIKLYDRAGKSLGETTIPLRVANKIPTPAQGIKLAYRWREDQQQKFVRRTELDTVVQGGPDQPLQSSNVVFTRTVEDATGGSFLIRDRVLPGSTLTKGADTQDLSTQYALKSKYRTVDTRGDVLRTMAPLSAGDHFGFSIPVLSPRRVAVGDTWQAPVEMTLEWAASPPATVNAESRLEGFEWQDGYPTAKIRETFSGPVTFNLATASAPAVSATTVNYERVVYFAYGSGRLVRMETTMTVTADLSAAQLGSSTASPAFNGPPQPQGLPDSPGAMPPGNYPGSPGFNPNAGGYAPPGGPPGYPGGPQNFSTNPAQSAPTVSNNYKATETTTQSS